MVLVVACGGGTDTPVPDAPANSPACTRATYDNCTVNADCEAGNCQLFSQDGIQVCTQPCDASTPCPLDSNGDPGTCNNRGICKPMQHTVCQP